MSGYPEANLVKRKQINNICTGCFYKYKSLQCPLNENKHLVCIKEEVIFQKPKESHDDQARKATHI